MNYSNRVFAAAALLASLSACTAQQLQKVDSGVVQGQLLCSKITTTGALVVPIIEASSGLPVSVVGRSAAYVAAICAGIGAIPVAPPPSASSISPAPVAVVLPPTAPAAVK